ncbi:MAG: hypothetical protein KAT58_11840 [candidate division Zixibacteria bacterium]|nr:hypothetical protein [candidate division Zixibacteria bacterium]
MKEPSSKNVFSRVIELIAGKPKRKIDFNVRRTTAWVAIFSVAIISAIPAIIVIGQPAVPINESVVSEQMLCGRRCTSKNNLCLHQAGVYQPSIERCEIKYDICRQTCLPPQPPDPKPMTLRRCADLYCKPQENICIDSAKNDEQRLKCAKMNIECLSRCRLAIKTGMPLPTTSLPAIQAP